MAKTALRTLRQEDGCGSVRTFKRYLASLRTYFSGTDAYRRVRIVLGLILLVAAATKGYQLVTDPPLERTILSSRWFLIGVVEMEVLLGSWLWSGFAPIWSWRTATTCFLLFSTISASKALSGEATCGCFGKLEVHPWISFGISAVALAGLAGCPPKAGPRSADRWAAVPAIGGLAIAVMAAVCLARFQASTMTAAGDIQGDNDLVVVSPTDWVGQHFSLARNIDIGDRLMNGLWLVLFFERGCGACEEAVARYQQLSADFNRRSGCPRIALIECVPHPDRKLHRAEGVDYGQLSQAYRWKLPTPVSAVIDGGEVRSVFEDPRNTDLVKSIWGT